MISEKINTKYQPTYFTKNEILYGCKDIIKIEKYGANKYLSENETINRYRHSNLLKLMIFVLNKR